jgi:lipopolysaccharide transport system ATP-binding protein
MATAVLKAENISKLYRLGVIGSRTVSEDISRWWSHVQGKEDRFLKIGEKKNEKEKAGTEFLWALKDINFEINQGEVLGIIGKNGAGKSTLLKILSRITQPTTGEIKIKGRIGSLLEVGTGFHPDLTGRENVLMNGTILGMKKWEIKKKFDEIVEFSGVEKFIDTPVKRYSSGMYVRLAFSVAAHFEPEIMIVDEVLAVGDADFQKKCINKMKEVSASDGKTILFVSHNISAIKQICNKGILLENGTVVKNDNMIEVLEVYQQMTEVIGTPNTPEFRNRDGNGLCRLMEVKLVADSGVERSLFQLGEKMKFCLQFKNSHTTKIENLRIIIGIYNSMGESYLRFDTKYRDKIFNTGNTDFEITCSLDEHLNIKPDSYSINVAVYQEDVLVDYVSGIKKFSVENLNYFESGKDIENIQLAKVYYKHSWALN